MRARTTAAAVLVGGVALVGAALLLVMLLQRGLEEKIRAEALLRAQVLAATLEYGTDAGALALPTEDDVLVQVVDERERVFASSRRLTGLDAAIADPRATGPQELRFESDAFVMELAQADIAGRTLIVIVAQSAEPIAATTAVAGDVLAVAIPVLLVVVGFTTWVIVGRALAPVEAIRQEVTEISAAQLHRRVVDPSGNDEVSRLARTMNEMLARLEDARTKQEHLVSDASHELRNPIAAIRHHAEVALAHPEQTSVDALARDVLDEDLRLQDLAEDLLLLAKMDEHKLELRSEPVDLDDVLLEEARRIKQATGLKIDTTAVAAARTQGDRMQLQRVVRNLVENAIRHARSSVRLATRENGDDVVLEVDDDGGGIALESRDAVFERFTRLDPARDRDHGGAGLGLAIVAEIVSAHGGSASVTDAPLGGARFEIVLPRVSG